jgi:hypothetical protein
VRQRESRLFSVLVSVNTAAAAAAAAAEAAVKLTK